MGWVLATLNKFLPGVKGHILPFLGSFSLTQCPGPRFRKPEYTESGRTELCHSQTGLQGHSGPVLARDRGEALTEVPEAPRLPALHSYLGLPGRRK